ncbi:MAG TPA: hypothetical protein VH277_02290 [Gemmatimonadaceae bacterium]|nr:hypothetical protein [Gemmatimonadaceae bacterium]
MRFVLAFAALLAIRAMPVRAQRDDGRIDIVVNPANALVEGPTIASDNLLGSAKTREHLRNGFPARVHYRLELWKKGVFDDLNDRADWDVLVLYDPTAQQYLVRRTSDQNVQENFGGFATLTSAEAQFGKPFRVGLHPTRAGRYYYNLVIEIQTLTETDLDALQQWLHGPTAPGKSNNPLRSLQSGLGTLFSRLLGGGTERREAQSGIFRVP